MAKSKIPALLPVLLSFGLLFSAGASQLIAPTATTAVTEELRWVQVNTPGSGEGLSAIVDLAIPPDDDGTIFLLTFDDVALKHSVWKSTRDGDLWEKVLTSTPPDIGEIRLVEVSSYYGTGSRVLYLAGAGNGSPMIWKSTDGGQIFEALSAPLPVDAWAVADDETLFYGSFDGDSGRVYRFVDGEASPAGGTAAGSQPINSVAVSPGYPREQAILAGNTTGQVYWSGDNGDSFQPLGNQLPLVDGIGEVTVAFDPEFSRNRTVYAATAGEVSGEDSQRIFRFVIGRSTTWESMTNDLPDNAIISGLAVTDDGVLYAIDSQPVDKEAGKGGMIRALHPASTTQQPFELINIGLGDGAVMRGLQISGNRLWSVDRQNIRLMSFTDTLAAPVILESPEDGSAGINPDMPTLSWERLPGATEYQWQIDDDPGLSSISKDFEDETGTESVRLPELKPNKTYYWHVRATQPLPSYWSSVYSFTTLLDDGVDILQILEPEVGATGIPLRPLFQWERVSGAKHYELLVSIDPDFTDLIIEKTGDDALPSNSWQCDTDLEYETIYYWKTRGLSEDSFSSWSNVGTFTTAPLPELPPDSESEPEPDEPETAEPPPEVEPKITPEIEPDESLPEQPPNSPPQSIGMVLPGWATYTFIALISLIAALLMAVLGMIIWIRRQ